MYKEFRVSDGLYVSANANIVGSITSVDSVQFDLSHNVSNEIGQLDWSIDDNTIELGLTPNVTLQIGQEQLYLVKNQTGTTIPDGTGAGVNAKPGISFMKYRGIENFYGNCWNWVDGLNININAAGTAFYTNNRANFVDDTSTNMTLLSSNIATASGFVRNINSGNLGFLPTSTVGSSSTTYITDQAFLTTSLKRVAHLGGFANVGVGAGVFCWGLLDDSSLRIRLIGARACF